MPWFCVKTKPKKERVSGENLRQLEGVEVYCPRVRFRRKTVRGPVWFNEALFPGYLFANFELEQNLRIVASTLGVTNVVAFAGKYPQIPEQTIWELRESFGADWGQALVLQAEVRVGDQVTVEDGPFRGFTGQVSALRSAKYRVAVLLEFLGQVLETELPVQHVKADGVSHAQTINFSLKNKVLSGLSP